jgi:hypothetical protein
VLGIVTAGQAGLPAPSLSAEQATLYRAGHGHAGVLLLLSLILQLAAEHARLSAGIRLGVRVAAIAGAVLVSAGFFATAHAPAASIVLYAGAACVVFATLTAGVGLLR